MATTPEIKTKFTLDGLRQAASGLRGFGRTVAETLGDARRRGGIVFDPMAKGLAAVEKQTKTVAKEMTRLGAVNTFRGIRLGALGAAVAVGGVATKMSAVSAAALKAAKDSAASLRAISVDAQRIGASPSDIAVLGYAADATGTDRDELVTQIATISNEFLTLRENIQKAQGTYGDFLNLTAKETALAKRLGNKEGLQGIISGFTAADLEARKTSIKDIEARIAQIDGALNTIRPTAPVYGGRDINGAYGDAARLTLAKERYQLKQAADEFRNSQSTQAQALYELEQFGIDVDEVSKGGVESLLAISDAFQRIEDPSQKARVAMRLFGEDAGVKLVPLLNGGRKAIDEYRRTLEESGGVASAEDIASAERYTRSVLNLKNAFAGVQMTVGRALWPDLTKTADELTASIIKGRNEIAKHAVEAFKNTRIFAEDAAAIIGGDTSGIQTAWLDATMKKTITVRDIWRDVRKQVSLLWNGKDSDYKWVNVIRDGLVSIKNFAADAWKQISLIASGKASDYQWLNDLVAGVQWFTTHLKAAFELFKTTLGYIKDAVKPILDFVGTDFATSAMFVGLLRLTGLLGGLKIAAGLAAGAIGKIGAAGVGAIAGRVGVGGAAASGASATSGVAASAGPGIAAAIASGGDTLADKIRRAWTAETTVGAISGSVANGVRSGASSLGSVGSRVGNGASTVQNGFGAVRDGFRDRWSAARDEAERRRLNPGPSMKERFADAAAGAARMRDSVVSATADAARATAALPGQAAAAAAEGYRNASKSIVDTAAAVKVSALESGRAVASSVSATKAVAIEASAAVRASTISTATALKDNLANGLITARSAAVDAAVATRSAAVTSVSAVRMASVQAAASLKDGLVTGLTMARVAAVDSGKATVRTFKDSGLAAASFAKSTGSHLKTLATDTDAWRGRVTALGTSFKSVGSAMVQSLSATSLSIGGVIEGLVVLGTTAVAAYQLGQQAAKWWYEDSQKAYDNLFAQQAALIRAQDQQYVRGLLKSRDPKNDEFKKRYWAAENVKITTAADRAAYGRQQMDDFIGWKVADGIQDTRSAADYRRAAQQPMKRVAVDLNVAGQTTTLEGDEVGVMQFTRKLEQATRGY